MRSGNGAVVRIVEQQSETPTARTQPPHCRDKFGIIPFVDDDKVRAPCLRGAFLGPPVCARSELGIGFAEGREPGLAMVLD